MNRPERDFSRRQLLEMAIGLSGFALSGTMCPAFADEAKRLMTRPISMGPFYPQIKPLDQDADLTIVKGKPGHAEGKLIHLMGRVMNLKGEPVSGAKVEIWQSDSRGRYLHPSDPRHDQADPNFHGFGVQITDAEGRYHLKTVRPAAYPAIFNEGMRTAHIHFEVSGKIDRLVTQMFFPDEPLNAQDVLFKGLNAAYKEAMTAKILPPTKDFEADSVIAAWDIVLIKG